jgi:UDP:flavonoid glycosyltransferase YjiC (YdhE family)
VLGALAHAAPLVVVPVATDQYEMAAQVERAGAGTVCSIQPLSPGAAREAFQEVSSDPAYLAASARLREQIVSMPTPADVIPRLDQLVAGATDTAAPNQDHDRRLP